LSNDDISRFVVGEVQVVAKKLHSHSSICWGFFVINDGLPMDLVKPQVLHCKTYRSK
jgi:hypothetical protein